MGIAAVSRVPFPVENQLEIIHRWEISGDARIVNLIRTDKNLLICQVLNRFTDERTHRSIRFEPTNQFESLSAYAKYISVNMHPVLGSNRHGPTCTAMLVHNLYQFVHSWYTGSNGEVEVKIFHKNDFLKGICIAMNTSSNNQKIFSLTKDIRAENARLYEPLVTYDVDGAPDKLDFETIHQIASSQSLPLLLEPALSSPLPLEPVIQSTLGQAASKLAEDELPPWDSQVWIVVREWDLGSGKKVRLCRFGNNFCSKYAQSGDFIQARVTHMPISPDITADEVFAEISLLQPFINPDGSVRYLITEKSRLNDGVMIDEENWGVTLADLGRSNCEVETAIGIGKCEGDFNGKRESPYSWGGHAVIVIEKIGADGLYKVLKGDALPGVKGQLVPRLSNESQEVDFKGNFSRSITWIRSKHHVEKMIEAIKGQIARYDKGKGHPVGKFRAIMPAKRPHSIDKTYNCIEWCKEQMLVACIKVPNNSSSIFLSTPVVYMNSKRGTVQKVATQAVASGLVGMAAILFWGAVGLAMGRKHGAGINAQSVGISASALTLVYANNYVPKDGNEEYEKQRI